MGEGGLGGFHTGQEEITATPKKIIFFWSCASGSRYRKKRKEAVITQGGPVILIISEGGQTHHFLRLAVGCPTEKAETEKKRKKSLT